MPTLSWRHHTLIQSLLSRGPLKEDDFHSVFSHVTGKSPGAHQQLFNEYLRKINAELGYVQFELRACRNQYDGNVYYGVVNNVSDDQSKHGTKYTVPQIAFYKGIVEAIIQDVEAQGSISNIQALNIRLENQVPGGTDSRSQGGSTEVPPAFKNFSMAQKEKTLEQLMQDKWLCLTLDGKIGLGVRSFLDLRSWFRTNEVPACEVCNEAAVKVERVCPGCGTKWPGSVVKADVGEEEHDPNLPSQNPQPPEPSVRTRRRIREVDNNNAESDSCPTSVALPETKRVTRNSARLKKPGKKSDATYDDLYFNGLAYSLSEDDDLIFEQNVTSSIELDARKKITVTNETNNLDSLENPPSDEL
ncbi:embryo defective [Forsythia ovata]|uniref:Non-structural maintenance of chromosomes element 1 homolog n=1 Tax=Forsythia ovata TaxID=205694 RepID=A0ABD1RII9_9LAMI